MPNRMPSPIVWAARGGIAPKEVKSDKVLTSNFLVEKRKKEDARRDVPEKREGVWVPGGREEDNRR